MSKASWVPAPGAAPATNLNVSLAVARQRLDDAHFRFALELIRRGQGEVAAPQALIIYGRLHDLTEIDLQALRNRVLVYLGQVANTDVTQLPNTFVAIDGGVEWDITASLVERIRKRLTGRRNHGFRDWIELHAGHVESKLVRMHVDNLAALVEVVDPDGKLSEMTRLYMREIGLRDSLYEAIHSGLLERIYESLDEDMGDESDDGSGEPPPGSGRENPLADRGKGPSSSVA